MHSDNESLVREDSNSPGEHRDGRHPSAAWTAEPNGPGDEKSKGGAGDRSSDNRLDCVFPSIDLDYDAGVRICGLSASSDPASYWCLVPDARAVALSPVARGSRHELVDHPRSARESSTRHRRRLSLGLPPDVSGPAHLLGGAGAR